MTIKTSETVTREFYEHLVKSHVLGHDRFHGKDHWLRVLDNAREIASATGANLRVVELFAVLHDSQRQNEDHDPDHGQRAADYATTLRGKWFELDDTEMVLLMEACRSHSDGLTQAHPTIQACWDADRLDLGRVGIRPDPRYLCTEYAKRPEVIEAAYHRSTQRAEPMVDDFDQDALCMILERLQDDWSEQFNGFEVLAQRAEIVSLDHDNLTRLIQSHLYQLPESDGFDFARNIPSSFVTERRIWTLTWPDLESFDDPIGFDESDYDYDDIDIGDAHWDDVDLPRDVFLKAIEHIDWWSVGEELDGEDERFLNAPAVLRPYLQNALALYRRQARGRWGYILYMALHPKFLWSRLRHSGMWRQLKAEQIHAFTFETQR